MHRKFMFTALEYMFIVRKLMFTARKHNFSRCKDTSFFRITQDNNILYSMSNKESLSSRPKDYEPVIWIKKAKNQTPHKKALRNLLVRLRIKNIDLVKLNYCFVLPNKNGKIAVFEYKDLKDSKNNSPKTPSDKYLVEILEIVFKGNEYQLTQMRNAINS